MRFAVLLPLVTLFACGDDEGGGTGGAGGASSSTTSTGGTGSVTQGGSGTGGDDGAGGEAAGGNGAGGEAAGGNGSGTGPSPVVLGDAGQYVILAKTAIVNVPTSAVSGDVGLSPAAASYIEGFPLTRVGAYWTTPEVNGFVFAADNDPPTPTNLTVAVGAMEAAYSDAAGRSSPDFLDAGSGGAIDGLTLAPGLYRWNSSVTIPDDVFIDGAADDTWIFQVVGDLNMSAAAAMTLQGGARASNIVWQVTGEVSFGADSHAEGVVLAMTGIYLLDGASITGRLMSQSEIRIAASSVSEP